MKKSSNPLTIAEFKKNIENGAWILDTRSAENFTRGFVPGAINIGLKGRFAEWAGQLLPFDQPVVLITEEGEEEEAIIELAGIGFHQVAGYLKGGFPAWEAAGEEIDLVIDVEVEEMMLDIPYDENLRIVDVRKPAEYTDGQIEGAISIPLKDMTDPVSLSGIEENQNIYVHCQSGYRSTIACSLIKRQGFHNLRNVPGGFKAIKTCKDVQIVKGPATMLGD